MTSNHDYTSLARSYKVVQFNTYADFCRQLSQAKPFLLLLKHHEDFNEACIADLQALQCDLFVANASTLPCLPLMHDAFDLPEVLAFDHHGQVRTRAHLDIQRFGSQHSNAFIINKAHQILSSDRQLDRI